MVTTAPSGKLSKAPTIGLAPMLLITVRTVPGGSVPCALSFNLIVALLIVTPSATTRSERV